MAKKKKEPAGGDTIEQEKAAEDIFSGPIYTDSILDAVGPEDFVTSTEEDKTKEPVEEKVYAKYTDPEWSDYVMCEFLPEELDEKGNPRLYGLRRVTELLLGEIAYSKPVSVSSNGESASVQWELGIYWRMSLPNWMDLSRDDLTIRVFGAYCGASEKNMKHPYSNYPESMACSRSEAKALRRALNLRCISSEEVQEKEEADVKLDNSIITEVQKCLIKNVSKRCNVDYVKLIAKQGKEIDALTRQEGSEICRRLNSIQQKREIPEDDIMVNIN